MFKYPEELIEMAEFENFTFGRVGSDTGDKLVAEVKRLRTDNAQLQYALEQSEAKFTAA